MPEGLKIVIDADVQKATKAIYTFVSASEKGLKDVAGSAIATTNSFSALEKQVAAFGGGVSKFTNNFKVLNSSILPVVPTLNKVTPALNRVTPALDNLQRTSSSATQSMINLGRVVQDAPYGFIGIANNLNPLLESFQRLKANTGSTGGALKALGKDLTGAGGIGLALSLVSSALLLFGDKIFGAGQKAIKFDSEIVGVSISIKQAEEAMKKLSSEFTNLKNIGSLTVDIGFGESFTRELLKAGQTSILLDNKIVGIEKQVVKLDVASKRAFSNFSDNAGKAAKGLVEQFGFITNVPDNLIDKLKDKDKELLKSAKDAAQAKFDTQDELDKAFTDRSLARANIRLVNENKVREDEEKSLEESKRRLEEASAAYKRYVSETIARGKELAGAFKNIAVVPEFTIFQSEAQQLKLAQQIIKDFSTASLKIKLPLAVEIEPPENKPVGGAEFGQLFFSELKDYFDSPTTTDFSLLAALRPAILTQAEQLGVDAAQAINSGLQKISVAGLAAIGEAIGTALAGGDLKDVFANFANILASGLDAIGKQLIAIGVAAALADLALKELFAGPQGAVLAIAAGVALVAAAAALRTTVGGGIKGFAQGGLVYGPTMGLIGEGSGTSRSNPEVIAPLDKLKGMLEGMGGGGMQRVYVTGRLRGNDMMLQNSRTQRSQRRATGV